MGIGLLHVKRRKNDVKWRPIVTKFGTLIDNMSRTGLYDCHIFFNDLIKNSNFGIRVLHVKVKYWRIFCDVISLLAQVFIVSFDRAYKEVSTKKILNIFYGSVFVIWLYLQKTMYYPCDLDLWLMKVNSSGEMITSL